jgi:TolB-like protein/Tfp pilus assembly protein PilF
MLVVIVVALGVISRYRSTTTVPPDPSKTMMVVLPFENLGPPEDDYFAAGITEEITTRLASFRELGVISRKSAIHYAETDKTAKQIGGELGVEYILEGTIRWARVAGEANRVRITPELIRTSDDVRLWSESYDRVIEDIFKIQTDIAVRVVEELGLTLLAKTLRAVDGEPTKNLEAYQAYLRGRYYAGQPHFTAGNWKQAARNYRRAVELDPEFALAYAKLSEAHARLYYFRVDLSEERREMAKSAVDRAISLSPDLPEVRLALGYFLLMVERDVEAAFREFAVAERDLPESAEILEAKGDGYRQQGKWLEAFDHYEMASRLSPRNTSPIVEFAITGWLYRRYPEAVQAADRAIAMEPGQDWPYLAKGLTYWSWRGASEEARRAFKAVSPDHDWYPWVWYWQYIYEGRYQEAIDHLSSIPGEWIRIKIAARPKVLYKAYAREALGQPELALADYETAKILLEAEVESYPEDPRYHSSLGIAYAALGRNEDAIREGKRAVELLPLSKDAMYGLSYLIDLAHIYSLLGNTENALDMIEELLTIPSTLSVPLLHVDPRWNRLRDHPRFIQLLKTYSRTDT